MEGFVVVGRGFGAATEGREVPLIEGRLAGVADVNCFVGDLEGVCVRENQRR